MGAQKKKGSYEIDMTNGPLMGKIIKFSIPLALSSFLQLLFNAADIIVVGRFASDGQRALAAVGSTGAVTQLIITLFIGLSVGVNVLVARYYGAGQERDLSETVHTAILISLLSGVALVFVGVALSRPLLQLMDTPSDVIDQSVLYMRIFFCGMPVQMLYNFGAAILRAVGDTRRPLYFLTTAGVVNVLLNLFFVIVLHMDVAGVATATVISQAISAILVLGCLVRSKGVYRVDLKKLRLHKEKLIAMTKIGVPAGIQGATFAISNVLIQSSVNSFGSVAMAGNTAGANIEGFVFVSMDALTQASLSFMGQNYGAKKFDRLGKVLGNCLFLVTLMGVFMGCGSYLIGRPLLGIYSSDPEVIEYGLIRMLYTGVPYFTCGIMNVYVGAMRGLGYSLTPMVISIFGVCGLRVLWIYTVLAKWNTWEVLFLSYPVSWIVTALVGAVAYVFVKKRAVAKAAGSAGESVA